MERGLKTDLFSVICSVWYIIRFIKSRPVRSQDSILNSSELRAVVHSGSTPALLKMSSSDTYRVFGGNWIAALSQIRFIQENIFHLTVDQFKTCFKEKEVKSL